MFSIITDARVYENADPKDRNLPPLILPEGSDVPLIGGERTPDVVVRSRYVPGAERVLVAAMSAFDAVCALGGEDLRVARADVDDLGIGVEDIAELTSYTEPTPVLGDAVHALLKELGEFAHACRVETQRRINSAYAVTRTWNDLETHEQDLLLRAANPAVRMLWDKEIRREWGEILWTAPVPLVLNTLDVQLLKGAAESQRVLLRGDAPHEGSPAGAAPRRSVGRGARGHRRSRGRPVRARRRRVAGGLRDER